MMHVRLSTGSGIAIHRQISDQIGAQIMSGQLAPGSELTTIRALAEQLCVNRNTVARAYLNLEYAGLVRKRRGAGTYVADKIPRPIQAERLKRIRARSGERGAGSGGANVERRTSNVEL
jgi:DNA-binding transcriptional regulator YhcF (GntR family)